MTAGQYYMNCGQFQKALKLFLSCGDKAIDQAIEVIGRAKSDSLNRQLLGFLLGDTDGVPKVWNLKLNFGGKTGFFENCSLTCTGSSVHIQISHVTQGLRTSRPFGHLHRQTGTSEWDDDVIIRQSDEFDRSPVTTKWPTLYYSTLTKIWRLTTSNNRLNWRTIWCCCTVTSLQRYWSNSRTTSLERECWSEFQTISPDSLVVSFFDSSFFDDFFWMNFLHFL